MRRLAFLVLLLLIAATVGAWLMFSAAPEASTVDQMLPVALPLADSTTPNSLRGRLAEPPDVELLAAARALLGPRRQAAHCGPYSLTTDVDDPRVLAACHLLASQLDSVYETRYGVRPRGASVEAIVLFATIDNYRAFASENNVPLGYAGYAIAARGLAVFYLGDQPFETFLTTLAHELTHLLSRRALGVNLPPWLAEGLADGIGDTATEVGFRPLHGVDGSEPQAKRLRGAYADSRAGSNERLVGLSRREFDRGVVSFDYEQSALFVRFLLDDPELATGFRSFLERLAKGEIAASPQQLSSLLGVGWAELDRRFAAWVQASS